jgi:hypothetical protein
MQTYNLSKLENGNLPGGKIMNAKSVYSTTMEEIIIKKWTNCEKVIRCGVIV